MVMIVGILILGAIAIARLGWTAIRWGIRWELRMVRLALHAAFFGAAVAVGALLWAGWLKL